MRTIGVVAAIGLGSIVLAGSGGAAERGNVRAQAVSNVNADRVDNFHANALVRVGGNARVNSEAPGPLSPVVSVSVNAPYAGYVLATATTTVVAGPDCPCFLTLGLHNLTTDEESPPQSSTVQVGDPVNMAATWVFPVQQGRQVIRLEGDPGSDTVEWQNPTVTALYAPFGAKGQRP
jgi:hypothetical protein